jgi:preprotein translocase subunit SecE
LARQTRAQRRARREAQQASAQAAFAGAPPEAPPSRPTARGGSQPQPRRQPAERHVPGSGARNFVGESWAELKKVEWPRQQQLIQGVVVVLVACLVVGVYLYGADLVFKRLVENVFLR